MPGIYQMSVVRVVTEESFLVASLPPYFSLVLRSPMGRPRKRPSAPPKAAWTFSAPAQQQRPQRTQK